MKPFQFYLIKRLPNLKPGQSVSNDVQMTFSGEAEAVKTTVKLETEDYENGLALLRVSSSIRHETFGYIKKLIASERRKIDFTEYLQPVDFEAYLDRERSLMIFQAPKKTCRGVLSHLRERPCDVELSEVEVDFAKVMQLNEEYLGAWFRGVSSRVHAAGLSGEQIQDDTLFKSLWKVASLSNVTIPWVYDGAEHPLMLTSRGGVVLVRNYQDISLELQLVMDVQERLLQHVWHERGPQTAANDSTRDRIEPGDLFE